MPSNWLIFDRIRALTKRNNIYQAEKVYQNQPSLDKLTAGGDFLDYNIQASILDQTNLQINRLERYKDYDMMDQTGEISLGLDLYADEASLVDPERKHTIIIRARNRRLKRELEDLFFNILLWDNQCRPVIRYLCKYGDMPAEIITSEHRTGVSAIRLMNVYGFTRVETKYGDLVGFFYQDIMRPEPVFLHPWQVMHLRLSSLEGFYHPYGKSILDGGRKAFKQLRLMEDAALVYRITRAPEKRKFTIPVGLIPPKEVPEYMQMIARDFKKQRFYNPSSGTFDERYSPLIQEDDFFLPRRPDGTGPDITTLPGAENLDQIADIEYFKKKMISPLKIPFERVGIGEGAGGSSEKSLSQSHSEFAKAVQWIQREASTGLTKIAIVHLALRGYSVEDLKGFSIALSATSAMEELYRIETWQTRVSVMADLKELKWFPKEWIVTRFTDLSPDEIEELEELEQIEANGGEGGGKPGGLNLPDIGSDTEDNPLPGEGDQEGEGGLPPLDDQDDQNKVEGFDYQAEKRLLNEINRDNIRHRKSNIVKEWSDRLGKGYVDDFLNCNSGFSGFLESNELDGLSKNTDVVFGVNKENICDPNDYADGLMVEWSVDKDDRDMAISEVHSIIVEAVAEPSAGDDSEITDDDILIVVNDS